MKRIAILAAIVAALAVPAASLAGGGTGGAGFDAHYARASARVTRIVAVCDVATPPARCTDAKAKVAGRLGAWESRIQSRIDKVTARPDSAKKTARLAELNTRLDKVEALAAGL